MRVAIKTVIFILALASIAALFGAALLIVPGLM